MSVAPLPPGPVRPEARGASGSWRGRAVVTRVVARRAVRSGIVWGYVFAATVVSSVAGFASAYPTASSRAAFARAFGGDVGVRALVGAGRRLGTVAGFTAWRSLGILAVLGGVWALFAATRLTRGEEEAGRLELLLAGRTTRGRAAAGSLAGLLAGLVALFAVTAVGAVAAGHLDGARVGAGAALFLALDLVGVAAAFLAIGALAAQLAPARWRATTLGGVVLGAAYALRMVGDSDSRLHGLVWATPFGWVEEARPLTGSRPLALLPLLALVLVASGAAVALAGRRDLGAGSLGAGGRPRERDRLLRGPGTLALRLARPSAIAWLLGTAAFGLLIGLVSVTAGGEAGGSGAIERAVARLGGHGVAVEDYLGLTFLVVALFVSAIGAGQVGATRAEEADGRAEHLLVGPVSRLRWLGGHLAVTAGLVVAAAVVAGVAAWVGEASVHGGVGAGTLLLAGCNVVAPALFLVGLGTLAHGFAPRATSGVVYGYLAWAFVVELLGGLLHASHWLMDTSIYFHLAPAPASPPDWGAGGAVALLGLAAAALGTWRFAHRDVAGG